MSDLARFWSRNLHGLSMAEHAICRELAEYHVAETNLCYPNRRTLCEIYEVTESWLKEILLRLDNWNLVTRIEWYDPIEGNRQTSNRYRLNLRRHFPDPTPEGRKTKDKNKNQTARPYDARDHAALLAARQGRRLLKVFASTLPPRHAGLMDGLQEAYLDDRYQTLWVTVDAEGYMRDFVALLPELAAAARKETGLIFDVFPVALYFRMKKTLPPAPKP